MATEEKKGGSVVLENIYDQNYEPSEKEIQEYAVWLGMDPKTDKDLHYIAREGLKAPLPDHWKACKTAGGELYYFNFQTGESIWDHPMDEHYKQAFLTAKAKRNEANKENLRKEQEQIETELKDSPPVRRPSLEGVTALQPLKSANLFAQKDPLKVKKNSKVGLRALKALPRDKPSSKVAKQKTEPECKVLESKAEVNEVKVDPGVCDPVEEGNSVALKKQARDETEKQLQLIKEQDEFEISKLKAELSTGKAEVEALLKAEEEKASQRRKEMAETLELGEEKLRREVAQAEVEVERKIDEERKERERRFEEQNRLEEEMFETNVQRLKEEKRRELNKEEEQQKMLLHKKLEEAKEANAAQFERELARLTQELEGAVQDKQSEIRQQIETKASTESLHQLQASVGQAEHALQQSKESLLQSRRQYLDQVLENIADEEKLARVVLCGIEKLEWQHVMSLAEQTKVCIEALQPQKEALARLQQQYKEKEVARLANFFDAELISTLNAETEHRDLIDRGQETAMEHLLAQLEDCVSRAHLRTLESKQTTSLKQLELDFQKRVEANEQRMRSEEAKLRATHDRSIQKLREQQQRDLEALSKECDRELDRARFLEREKCDAQIAKLRLECQKELSACEREQEERRTTQQREIVARLEKAQNAQRESDKVLALAALADFVGESCTKVLKEGETKKAELEKQLQADLSEVEDRFVALKNEKQKEYSLLTEQLSSLIIQSKQELRKNAEQHKKKLEQAELDLERKLGEVTAAKEKECEATLERLDTELQARQQQVLEQDRARSARILKREDDSFQERLEDIRARNRQAFTAALEQEDQETKQKLELLRQERERDFKAKCEEEEAYYERLVQQERQKWQALVPKEEPVHGSLKSIGSLKSMGSSQSIRSVGSSHSLRSEPVKFRRPPLACHSSSDEQMDAATPNYRANVGVGTSDEEEVEIITWHGVSPTSVESPKDGGYGKVPVQPATLNQMLGQIFASPMPLQRSEKDQPSGVEWPILSEKGKQQATWLEEERTKLDKAKEILRQERKELKERQKVLQEARFQWKKDCVEAKKASGNMSEANAKVLSKVYKALENQAAALNQDAEILAATQQWVKHRAEHLDEIEFQLVQQQFTSIALPETSSSDVAGSPCATAKPPSAFYAPSSNGKDCMSSRRGSDTAGSARSGSERGLSRATRPRRRSISGDRPGRDRSSSGSRRRERGTSRTPVPIQAPPADAWTPSSRPSSSRSAWTESPKSIDAKALGSGEWFPSRERSSSKTVPKSVASSKEAPGTDGSMDLMTKWSKVLQSVHEDAKTSPVVDKECSSTKSGIQKGSLQAHLKWLNNLHDRISEVV